DEAARHGERAVGEVHEVHEAHLHGQTQAHEEEQAAVRQAIEKNADHRRDGNRIGADRNLFRAVEVRMPAEEPPLNDAATTRKHPDLVEALRASDAPKVKVAVTDIDGVLRGKYLHRDKFLSALDGGFGFCDVVFGWDVGDQTYDNTRLTGWHQGFPDA